MFTHLVPLFLIIGGLVAAPLGAAGPPAPAEVRQDVVVGGAGGAGEGADGAGGVDVRVEEVDVVLPSVDETVPVEPAVVEQQPEAAAVVSTDEVAVAEVAVEDRVVSPVVRSDGFQTLGVTWSDGSAEAPTDIQVRTLDEDGWSDWAPLEIADDAPDAGSPDAQNAVRAGTDPLWVGDAEAVQLSFAAQDEAGPADLRLSLIGSEEVSAPAGDAVIGNAGGGTTTGAVAEVSQTSFLPAFVRTSGEGGALPAVDTTPSSTSAPTVITRAQWGAAPQTCTPSAAAKLVGAVVHHTAGSNDYATVAQAMQQLRNDQRYHMVSRGWCDLGYNFVVDKWGNIYEGRARSMTQAVIGVHAGGFNTGTVGVSMLGNYSTITPSTATQQAVGRIIGWRLGAYGLDPATTMSYHTLGGENSKVKAGTTVTLPRVFPHGDVAYTACPGSGGYRVLGSIRQVAASQARLYKVAESAPAVVTALYQDLLGRAPDASGLATWSAALGSGTGQPELVSALTRSEEYIRLRITQAYREVLGRNPDASGMAYWYGRITSGSATVDDVKRRFYDSAEYYQRAGGTAEGYVDLLYRTMFERPASASEQAYWTQQIAALGRPAVVDAIWFSFEAARYRAGGYYRAYLDREPDAAGQTGWARVLLDQGEHAVRVGIAGSEEYRRLAVATYGTTA